MRTSAPRLRSVIANERGVLTTDFLFAFTLVFGMTLILFALCLTLTVVEITQYITFSAARNYYAAHVDPAQQEEVARQKYAALTQTPVFRTLYTNGWFQISDLEVGLAAERVTLAEYASGSGSDRNTFVGARVTLNAKVLEMQIPFFGTTYDQTDGFVTRVASFLGRAPSNAECMNVTAARWQQIRQLDPLYQTVPDSGYHVQADNGC